MTLYIPNRRHRRHYYFSSTVSDHRYKSSSRFSSAPFSDVDRRIASVAGSRTGAQTGTTHVYNAHYIILYYINTRDRSIVREVPSHSIFASFFTWRGLCVGVRVYYMRKLQQTHIIIYYITGSVVGGCDHRLRRRPVSVFTAIIPLLMPNRCGDLKRAG